MKIPSPSACGLPAKIDSWRPDQERAVDVMITNGKRFTALSAPTGFGKSPAYVAGALLSGIPTCILTNSKGLQDQLMRDYKSIGMVDIRGRGNYICGYRDEYSCNEGHATGCPYKGTVACPSSQAEMRAASSNLCVTNYDKWIANRNTPGSWANHFGQLVLDEGHDAPDAVANAMHFTLTDQMITEDLELHYPRHTDTFGCWKEWAVNAAQVAEGKMFEWKYKIDCEPNPKLSWVKQFIHLKELTRRLTILATGHPLNWVVDETPEGFQFDPIWPGRYSDGVLFLRTPRITIVSATLRPKTMGMLGVSAADYTFHEFDSSFDPARCPIYWIPTMRVDVRATDLSSLWIKLDQIMARRRDRKGIVHTVSYLRRDEVLSKSRFRISMMTNDRGASTTAAVDVFKQAGPGTTFVSPSISTGYDFPGKECEWQFMCKIPFPDGRSKIFQARQQVDKEYGAYIAMQAMVQSFGRGMRSKEDQCEGFICDDHIAWFLPKNRHLAPKSFHGFFKKVDYVPQPPAAL